MRANQLIKKAESAEKRRQAAEATANTARKECESHLSQALVLASTVNECIGIRKLTDNKERAITAWTKAVMLLGVRAKDFEDFILVLTSRVSLTQKQDDVWEHWKQKKRLFLSHTFDPEQLWKLLLAGEERFAREAFARQISQCDNVAELEELKVRYEHRVYIWCSSTYERTLARLCPELAKDEKPSVHLPFSYTG